MTRMRWIWLSSGLLYVLFFSGYTSFGGPLTEEEIGKYLEHYDQRGVQPEQRIMLERFMRADTGDDFVVLNAIDLYETPLQIEGVEPDDSSSDVLDKYMEFMYPALFARASHPVIFGEAANTVIDLMNARNGALDQGVMRYRSRRDFSTLPPTQPFPAPTILRWRHCAKP